MFIFCIRLHGGDNVQIKRYFVSFWNGVDLRYKLLKGPKIRISIAGIIISRVKCNFMIFYQNTIVSWINLVLVTHNFLSTFFFSYLKRYHSGKRCYALFGKKSRRSRCNRFGSCVDRHGEISLPRETTSGLWHRCRCYKVRVHISLNSI